MGVELKVVKAFSYNDTKLCMPHKLLRHTMGNTKSYGMNYDLIISEIIVLFRTLSRSYDENMHEYNTILLIL